MKALVRLILAAQFGAVLGAVLNIVGVLVLFDAFRVRRDLEVFRLIRAALTMAGFELLRVAPVAVSYPLGREWDELLLFAAMAVALSAASGVLLALLAWPVARRGKEPLPTTVLVTLACCPALSLPARRLARALALPDAAGLGIFVILSCVLGLGAWWLLRKPARQAAVVRAGGAVAAAIAGASCLGLIVHPGTGIPDAPPRDDAARPLPNVLLVSIDSLRADHLGCYGYPRDTSPNIDRVAAEGVRFATTVAPTSWTLPSHLTLLTGLSIAEHGVATDQHRLPLAALTLAEVLRGAGYRTVGIVGGPYLEARYGFAQGFEAYDDYTVVADSNAASHRGITSPRLVRLATRWLESWQGSAAPFFMFLHLWDVHYDYIPPPPYDTMFDPGYDGRITGRNVGDGPDYRPPMEARDLNHLRALYDGEIAFTDHHLGRLLDWLRERGLLDRTLVVITSDHGEEFFEHGELLHRNNLYDESLLVPLVVRYPTALPEGAVVSNAVRLQDVAPTILSLSGLGPVVGFGSPWPGDPLAGRSLVPLDQLKPMPASGDLLGKWLFLRSSDAKVILGTEGSDVSLFDLVADPGEKADVAASQPERASSLRRELVQWLQRTKAPWSGRDLATAEDEEHLERLRSLGYVD